MACQLQLGVLKRNQGNTRRLLMPVRDDTGQKTAAFLSSLYEPPTLVHLLESGRWEDAEEKLRESFDQLKKECSGMREHILEAYFVIAGSFTYIAHKNGRQLENMIAGNFRKMLEPDKFQSAVQLQDWSLHILQQMRNCIGRDKKGRCSSVVREVNCFAESHLAKGMTLQDIASYINLHPIYLSKIYKAETGENIKDYLHRFRMEKAAYLLKNTRIKIYDITAELGYQNPNYFARIFRSYFGLSPLEYRNS